MNLGSETIHIRLYILTFSYILLIMCFALYVAKKNQATNETPTKNKAHAQVVWLV